MEVVHMDKLAKLREHMGESGLDGILILQPENRRYLSGFTGSSGALLVTMDKALLFTDFRYIEQATKQAPQFEIVKHAPVVWDTLRDFVAGLAKLAFEQNFVTFETYQILKQKLAGPDLVPVSGIVENLRSIKTTEELLELERAVDVSDSAFSHIVKYVEPGMTERQIALELEFFMRKNGASGPSFDFIVASGPRSSLPHGIATDRIIAQGEFVKLDFGCVVNGYCSDITRTLILGEPNAKQQEIYEIVLEAQLKAEAAIRPGVTGKEIDAIARQIISDHGYGDNFGHGLGHAVGLAIHEEPRLSPTGERVLQPGMVVTVEPGIYLPDWGGVRIEDMVVVTETGCRILTKAPKELIVL
jgi:Xaa-Pro aminopeptidase